MANRPYGGWPPHPPPGGFGPSQQGLPPTGHPGTSSERGFWQSTSPRVSLPSPLPQMRPNGPYFQQTGAPQAPFMPPWIMQPSSPVGPNYNALPMQRPSYNASGYAPHPHSPRNFAGMNVNPRLAVMPVPQGSNFSQMPPQGSHQQALQVSQQQGQQTPAQGSLGLPTGDQKMLALVPSNREHFDASHSFSWLFQEAENASVAQSPVESLGDGSTGGLHSEAEPQRATVSKVAELHQLMGQVEETIGKVLSVVNLKSLVPGTELAFCPIDPRHRVPAKALFRHFIQCNSGFQGGPFEVDSFLGRLQYPQTAPVMYSDPLMLPEEDTTAPHVGSRDNATLSFEDSALLTVNPNYRDLSILKQEIKEAQPSINSAVDFPDSLKVRPAEGCWMSKSGITSFVSSLGKREFHLADSFFFYRGAPGVVLKPSSLPSRESNDFTLSLPLCLQAELASDLVVERTDNSSTESTIEKLVPCNQLDKTARNEKLLLPSMVWFIEREVEAWEHLPTWCSGVVLEAGAALGSIRKSVILEWLLVHSPLYGVAVDVAMACHIRCLVQLFLRAVKTQCTDIVRKYLCRRSIKKEGMMLEDLNQELVMPKIHKPQWNADCPVFAEAGAWLVSSLSPLYGCAHSKAIVLHVLKYCLKVSARLLSCVPFELHLEQFTKVCTMGKGKSVGSEMGSSGVRCDALVGQGRNLSEESEHGEMICVKQVEAAIDALYERAAIGSHINFRNSVNSLTKLQL